MEFEVWLSRRESPAAPIAGEPKARLVAVMLGPGPLKDAAACARGFNEAEAARPVGAWAYVLRAGLGKRGMLMEIGAAAARR